MAESPYKSDSSDSPDNEGEDGIPQCYLPEEVVLNSGSKGEDSDQWPVFLMEDVTVYLKDRVTLANLLNVEMEGTLIVRGRLSVLDIEKEWKLLTNENFKNAHIEIICQTFSIGHLPTTIWAEGGAGWFEIRPSAVYKNMYTKMSQGVEIYFGVVQAYEDVKKSIKKGWQHALTVDEVLESYAMMDSTGLYRSEILARIDENAQFLLLHMLKSESMSFKNTTFYKWLTKKFSDIYIQIQEKSRHAGEAPTATRETRIVPPRKPITTSSSESLSNQNRPLRQRFSSYQEEVESRSAVRKSGSDTPLSTSSRASGAGSIAKKLQLSATEVNAITAVIVRLMDQAVATGRYDRQKMGTPNLWGMLYRDYSVHDPKDCKRAVEIAAPSIMANLDDEWEDTKVYKDLDVLAKQPDKRVNASTTLKAVFQGEGLKQRVKTVRANSKPAGPSQSSRSNLNVTGTSTRSASTASTSSGPRAAKTLPPTQAAQPTGKAAALRLAQNTLKRTSDELSAQLIENDEDEADESMTDVSYVDDPYRGLRKRSRNPAWETIGPKYMDGVTRKESPFFQPNGEREHNQRMRNPGYELVEEALPSLTPTGPLASWVCPHARFCSYQHHEPQTLEGRSDIREHIEGHMRVEARRDLVMKEAAAAQASFSNLLDKIARVGAANQEEQKSINGKPIPKRKRNRYGVD